MPAPADRAAARRDARLASTRRISLCVAGAAAIASVGLGAAFAHALPGHAAQTAAAQRPASRPTATPSPSAAAAAPQRRGRPRHLHPPQQPPASTPAPPAVVSGGS